jgi:hypothetical protein
MATLLCVLISPFSSNCLKDRQAAIRLPRVRHDTAPNRRLDLHPQGRKRHAGISGPAERKVNDDGMELAANFLASDSCGAVLPRYFNEGGRVHRGRACRVILSGKPPMPDAAIA